MRINKTLKYTLIFILFFLIFIILFSFFLKSSKDRKKSTNTTMEKQKDISKIEPKFYWGVTTGGYVFNKPDQPFTLSHLQSQLPYIKKLGVNVVRFNLEHHGDQLNTDVNTSMIDTLTKNNIERYAMLGEPVYNIYTQGNYQIGYDWGYKIATTYKGEIQFYQLSNEISGMAIKHDYPGNKVTDYEEKKYIPVMNYLKGLSDGIHTGDPQAKRVITAHWLGVGIIDKLISDNVNFDIIGWDWYSDMGDNPTHKELDDGTVLDIPKYLSKYNKPFWIVEVNADHGSAKLGETGQAKYIQSITNNILKSGEVDGFIVYQLFDISQFNPSTNDIFPPKENDSWGLVRAAYNPKTKQIVPGKIKEAYTTYQNIIKKYPDGYK